MDQKKPSKIKKLTVLYIVAIIAVAAIALAVYFANMLSSRINPVEITFGTKEILYPDYLQKNSANWKVATLVYLDHEINLTKISLYAKAESGTAKVRCAIYENNALVVHPNSPNGTPSSLITPTFEVTVDETARIYDFNVTSEVVIDPGYYWLTFVASETIYTASGSAGVNNAYATMCYNPNTYDGFTDPFGEITYAISADKTIYGTGITT